MGFRKLLIFLTGILKCYKTPETIDRMFKRCPTNAKYLARHKRQSKIKHDHCIYTNNTTQTVQKYSVIHANMSSGFPFLTLGAY